MMDRFVWSALDEIEFENNINNDVIKKAIVPRVKERESTQALEPLFASDNDFYDIRMNIMKQFPRCQKVLLDEQNFSSGLEAFNNFISNIDNGNKLELLKQWIMKQKVAYHKHDGFSEHPVAVKHYQEYFSDNVSQEDNIQSIAFSDPELKHVVNVLSRRGTPYLVGGGVRDILLGKSAKDFDIEVHGISVDELGKILSEELGAKGEQVGKQFGVFKVGNFDVSLPRTETKIGEKHTDFDIRPDPNLTPKDAARRRDFSINAIYLDVKKLIDHYCKGND